MWFPDEVDRQNDWDDPLKHEVQYDTQAVTTCLAAVCTRSTAIVAVTDTKFSFGTGSSEGWKLHSIHRDWHVLYAGSVSPCAEAVLALQAELDHKPKTVQQVRTALVAACHSWPCQEQERRSLLVIGFENRRPRIFTAYDDKMHQNPHVVSHLARGYAAIGSGAAIALHILASYEQTPDTPLLQTAYTSCAAKFFSESADGVGSRTYLCVFKPGELCHFTGLAARLRRLWRTRGQLPPIPHAKLTEIAKRYEGLDIA